MRSQREGIAHSLVRWEWIFVWGFNATFTCSRILGYDRQMISIISSATRNNFFAAWPRAEMRRWCVYHLTPRRVRKSDYRMQEEKGGESARICAPLFFSQPPRVPACHGSHAIWQSRSSPEAYVYHTGATQGGGQFRACGPAADRSHGFEARSRPLLRAARNLA